MKEEDIGLAEFEEVVARAVAALPDQFLDRMDNVAIMAADTASEEQRKASGTPCHEELLGLYEGIPLPLRTSGYGGVAPDIITIFRLPLLAVCRNRSQLVSEIQRVVRHEIAHHFGIDDDRLDELENNRR